MKIGGGEDVRFVRGFEVLNSLDEVVHLGLHQTSGQPLLTVPGLPGMPGGPSGAICSRPIRSRDRSRERSDWLVGPQVESREVPRSRRRINSLKVRGNLGNQVDRAVVQRPFFFLQ